MIDIHTIAAGGGSIVRYADGRLQVGPDSAGADPGPPVTGAAARPRSPTATWCSVAFGRTAFRACSARRATQPLDPEASQARLAAIAEEVATAGGPRLHGRGAGRGVPRGGRGEDGERDPRTRAAPRRGRAAVRAGALRRRGRPARLRRRRALGIDTLLLHPLAGVLSAWGIGLARRRCLRRRSVEVALDAAGMAAAAAVLDALSTRRASDLERQRIARATSSCGAAHLRVAGSDTALEVPWQDQAGCAALPRGPPAAVWIRA